MRLLAAIITLALLGTAGLAGHALWVMSGMAGPQARSVLLSAPKMPNRARQADPEQGDRLGPHVGEGIRSESPDDARPQTDHGGDQDRGKSEDQGDRDSVQKDLVHRPVLLLQTRTEIEGVLRVAEQPGDPGGVAEVGEVEVHRIR